MTNISITCLLHLFIFIDPAPSEIYTLSLHDALPICPRPGGSRGAKCHRRSGTPNPGCLARECPPRKDRKSTRLNSSHLGISYAVFCLKKKKYPSECNEENQHYQH